MNRATKYLRYIRPPPNFYDGLIDFYKVRTDHMRPGNPEGDMPKSFPHMKSGGQEFGNPVWGGDYIDKVYPNRSIDYTLKTW